MFVLMLIELLIFFQVLVKSFHSEIIYFGKWEKKMATPLEIILLRVVEKRLLRYVHLSQIFTRLLLKSVY